MAPNFLTARLTQGMGLNSVRKIPELLTVEPTAAATGLFNTARAVLRTPRDRLIYGISSSIICELFSA